MTATQGRIMLFDSRGWRSGMADHFQIGCLAVSRSVIVVEHGHQSIAAPLIESARRLIIGAVRRLNVNPRAPSGSDLILGFLEQDLADALPLLARLDGDPVHVEAADRDRIFAKTDVTDTLTLLFGKDKLIPRRSALFQSGLDQLDRHVDFAYAK